MSATMEECEPRTFCLTLLDILNSCLLQPWVGLGGQCSPLLLNNPPSWPDIPATYQVSIKVTKLAGTALPRHPPCYVFLWNRFDKQLSTHQTVPEDSMSQTFLIMRIPRVLVTEFQSLPGVLIDKALDGTWESAFLSKDPSWIKIR